MQWQRGYTLEYYYYIVAYAVSVFVFMFLSANKIKTRTTAVICSCQSIIILKSKRICIFHLWFGVWVQDPKWNLSSSFPILHRKWICKFAKWGVCVLSQRQQQQQPRKIDKRDGLHNINVYNRVRKTKHTNSRKWLLPGAYIFIQRVQANQRV